MILIKKIYFLWQFYYLVIELSYFVYNLWKPLLILTCWKLHSFEKQDFLTTIMCFHPKPTLKSKIYGTNNLKNQTCTFWSCTLTSCKSNELVLIEMMHLACKPIINLSLKRMQQNWDLMQDEMILQDEPFMKPGLRNASKHRCSSSHCICFPMNTIVGSH